MGLALLVAIASVILGVLVAWWGRSRPGLFGPVRTVALVASVAVALAQLLPEALLAIGWAALPMFAVGLALPAVFEKMATESRDVIGLEIGFAGLCLHKLGDGVALGTYASPLHEGAERLAVMAGIAGHTVPIVALVFILYAQRRGTASAAVRAGLLGVSAALGAVLASVVPLEALASLAPYVTATAAGMLLHVVFHDWRAVEDPPSVRARRLADLSALALGTLLVFAGSEHGHGTAEAHASPGEAFVSLLLAAAPVLVAGLFVAAIVQLLGSRAPIRWRGGVGPLRHAVRGALAGATLPTCACGVRPFAQSLRARGAGAAMVGAFLLATPSLGVETFALTARFLGWRVAAVRVACAVLLAVVAALVLSRLSRRGAETRAGALSVPPEPCTEGSWPARWLAHVDELLHHVGPWMLVGLVAGAYADVVLAPGDLGGFHGLGADVLVVSALVLPSYVCAGSATPLGAVLLAKGLSPSAVIAGLLLGPTINFATLGFLRGAYGTRAALLALASIVAVVWAAAYTVEALELPFAVRTEPDGSIVGWASVLVLGGLVVRSVWKDGLRRWLGSLGDTWPSRGGGHGHGHGHG